MFDRPKAIKYYKAMLKDLKSIKEALQANGNYEGIDRGSVIIPKRNATKKVNNLLTKKALRDGYNIEGFDVQNAATGKLAKVYVIDNESEEIKNQRMLEVFEYVDSIEEQTGRKSC